MARNKPDATKTKVRPSTQGSKNQGSQKISRSKKPLSRKRDSAAGSSSSKQSKYRNTGSKSRRVSRGEQEEAEEVEQDELELDFPEPPTERTFAYLEPQIRHISQDVLMSEWRTPLKEPAQRRIRELLTIAKRSVISSSKTSKRAEELEIWLEPLARKLSSRLGRMPLPPKSTEDNFDLEKLLERSRNLEAQLTAVLHSVELLNKEIEKEEHNLDDDHKELAKLESNAKKDEAFWKRQASQHTVIELPDEDETVSDSPDAIGLIDEDVSNDLFDEDDPELAPVFEQLSNHLNSILANYQQVDGIPETMSQIAKDIGEITGGG